MSPVIKIPFVHILSLLSFITPSFQTPVPAAQSAVPAAGASSLKATTWAPPSSMSAALDAVWKHEMSTYSPQPDPLQFKNYGYNQVLANKGSLSFCVRWESSQTATPVLRAQISSTLKSLTKQWMDVLSGFEGWPYPNVAVNVTGWAARSASLLPSLNEQQEGFKFYTDKDQAGAPQCAPACGRFFHQDGNYGSCPGGAANHYDMSLWLTDGFQGGAGGDWGQRLGTEGFLSAMQSGQGLHIFLHEMGHTFGLDDFYDWTPSGQTNFVMKAGSAMFITEFDAWMLRDWWRHLKPKLLG